MSATQNTGQIVYTDDKLIGQLGLEALAEHGMVVESFDLDIFTFFCSIETMLHNPVLLCMISQI